MPAGSRSTEGGWQRDCAVAQFDNRPSVYSSARSCIGSPSLCSPLAAIRLIVAIHADPPGGDSAGGLRNAKRWVGDRASDIRVGPALCADWRRGLSALMAALCVLALPICGGLRAHGDPAVT